MYLSFRTTKLKEIGQCLPLVQDHRLFTPDHLRHLSAFWNYVLSEQIALSSVVEDHGRPSHQRIVGFEMSLFIKDEYLAESHAHPPAHMALQVLERWRQGRRVFLNPREIARQNSQRGLNALVLHFGYEQQGMHPEEALKIRLKLSESFLNSLHGYQINEILREVYSAEEKQSLSRSGFVLRRDHRGQDPSGSYPEPSKTFCLFGINREEGKQCDQNNALAQLFHCPAGRFSFSPRQKHVLQLALQGRSDSEIASRLQLSLWTVKKRWQGIYEKVQAVDPDLLTPPEELSELEKEAMLRRPYLLDYLRNHREEIRPSLPLFQERKGTEKTEDPLARQKEKQAIN
jgi:DNA-binding CsgD family transcriptional regulator